MNELEINLPPNVDVEALEHLIDETLEQCDLRVTMRDTLKQYPGCVHWHLKQGRQPGTLELTLWPQKRRLWFAVHRNRTAPWLEVERKHLQFVLQGRLTQAEA